MLIEKKPNKILLLLLSVGKPFLVFAVIASMFGQCISNANLSTKIDEIRARNIPVQVGRDRTIYVGEKLTEVENREQFIAGFFKSISWVKQTTPDFQKSCKEIARRQQNQKFFRQCESGIDPGINTPFGKFTTQIGVYQNLIAIDSQKDIMKWILDYKPSGFDSPKAIVSRSFFVTRIGHAEDFKERNVTEKRTPVEIELKEAQGSVVTRRILKYYWVHTTEILTPIANGAKTPFSAAVDASQQRGLLVTRILPYTDKPL